MTAGWFADVDPTDRAAAATAIREGSADEPADWPARAVESGAVPDEGTYYESLHDATVAAARAAVQERERSQDQQLVHAVRAMDDCSRTANELAERLAEWAGTRDEDAGTGVEYARTLVGEMDDGESTGPVDDRVQSLATRVVDLANEAAELRRYLERTVPDVAPNLAAIAGPVLSARLIALAGGLEDLAKQPSGTVQVLGAEDALFAHLRGAAPSPKHGVIYTHEYVRGTSQDERGSAARALAGKLSIAARVDHYAGEYRPEIEVELHERIQQLRERESE